MSILKRIQKAIAERNLRKLRETLFEQTFPSDSVSPEDRATLKAVHVGGKVPERSGYAIRYVDLEEFRESPSLAQFNESVSLEGGENFDESLELGVKDYAERTGKLPTFIELPEFYSRPGWKFQHKSLPTRYSSFLGVGEFILGTDE